MSFSRRNFLIIFVGLLASKAASFVPSWHLHHHHHHQHRHADRPSLSLSSKSSNGANLPIVIALTREEGKNDKLRQQLTQQLESTNQLEHVDIVELPCIAHADGPDYHQLKDTLSSQPWDYVTITSPEAARVLASAWSSDGFGEQLFPMPEVAAVGKATEETLNKAGIPVAFCPSKATAKVLVQELPTKKSSATTTVLYPASAQAKTTLQDGLTERGFAVTRLNTYDTVTATWTSEQKEIAAKVQIVCVASPSSLKGWLANTRGEDDTSTTSQPPVFLAACIGETSAEACRELGFAEDQIYYPDKPGIPGWVETIEAALQSLTSTRSANNDPAMTASN